jgi:hypothetical protein
MDRYEKIDPIYKFTLSSLLMGIVSVVMLILLVVYTAMLHYQLSICTVNSCFGLDLTVLVPDYSQTIAGIAENMLQEQKADSQLLSKQLFEIYQELLVMKATIERFKILLPS